MNFVKIASRDIRNIVRNRFVRLSVIAIIIVPLLYSLLYLAAFWDPYNRLQTLPVAVVNADKGTTVDGKDSNYGSDVVDKLKSNKQVAWKFVSKEDGDKGVKDGKYYLEFVIPDDFSEKVLSAKSGTPKQANIEYYANSKKNFIASQIGSKIELEVKDEISKSITDEYTKVAFDSLYEVKDGMGKASDGSKQLNDGIISAQDGSHQLSDGTKELNGKIPDLANGILQLNNGGSSLNNGLRDAQNGVAALYNGAGLISFNLGKAYNGSLELSSGLGQINAQIPTLTSGVSSLYGGAQELYVGAQGLNSGIKDAQAGVNQLYVGFTQKLLPGAGALKDGLNNLSKGLSGAGSAVKGLNDGAGTLNAYVSGNGGNNLTQGAKSLSDGLPQLTQGSKQLTDGYNQMAPTFDMLKTGSQGVSDGVNALISKVSDSQTAINNAVNTELMAYIKNNPKAMDDPNMQSFMKTLQAISASEANNQPLINQLQAGAKSVAEGNAQLADGAKDFTSGAQKFAGGAASFSSGAAAFSNGAGQFAQGAQTFAGGASSLAQGMQGAVDGAGRLASGANDLYNGMNGDFKNGLTTLNSKLPDAVVGSGKLVGGSQLIYNGLGTLNSNTPVLAAGLSTAGNGADNLAAGLGQLKDGAGKLQASIAAPSEMNGFSVRQINSSGSLFNGVTQLYNGSTQLSNGLNKLNSQVPTLSSGVTKLADGSSKLTDGMDKLSGGSKDLHNSLNDGANKLNTKLLNSSSSMGKFVSAPVGLSDHNLYSVKTYGEGFAPYFIPLSLWVGAMLMFFVISDKVDDDIKAGPIGLVAGKFLCYSYVGIAQAVLVSVVVLSIGLRPKNMIAYFGFNIFMSLVFIAIIQCLVFLLGQAGRLLSIVLLIFQLTTCGGTFPMETVPTLFKVLNPYLPFTYCVSALREIVGGVDYSVFVQDISLLACYMVGFLIISMVMKRHADRVQQLIKQKSHNLKEII